MRNRFFAVLCGVMCLTAVNVLARHDKGNESKRPSEEKIEKLETIKLTYEVTDRGLELRWNPANETPSGGLKITASTHNPNPLYPYDGYVKWLSGTGKSSCVIPLRKAASHKPRYWRVCSVHRKNHRRYVALSNVVKVPAIDKRDAKKARGKQEKKYEKKKKEDTMKKDKKEQATKTQEATKPHHDGDKDKSTDLPGADAAKRPEGAMIIGHESTDVNDIPATYLAKAKNSFRVWYGHTSHGRQITSGMQAMNKPPFQFNRTGRDGALEYNETGGDLGHKGDDAWEKTTRRYLERGGDANVIMWSWCGGCSDNTPDGVDRYLELMDGLEKDHPDRIFIYMTGHLDGTGEDGNLHRVNERIRAYCGKNGKVLYDFADIESYDPDGNYYLDKGATDSCRYQGGNWAEEWIEENPDHDYSLPRRAAHTHPLNGALKGRAFWSMMAQLAGWKPDK